MIKCTLDTYRIYMRRKEELEGMKNGFKRRYSKDEWHKFDENLNEIKHYLASQKEIAIQCIDTLDLSDEEKEIAKNYYIEGKEWTIAIDFSSKGERLSDEERNNDKTYNSVSKQINRIINKAIPNRIS